MDNNPSITITDTAHVDAAGGKENVSAETVNLFELVNKELGTTYKDDAAALAGLKQTKDYVGRVGQVMPFFDKAKELGIPTSKLFEAMDNTINNPQGTQPTADTSKFVTREEMDRELFYKDNPQYVPFKPMIDAMATSQKVEASAVVGQDAFKTIFDKAKGFDEVQRSKSVLQTNSRLGVASDSMTKASEAMKNGNQPAAVQNAMDAVLETMKK